MASIQTKAPEKLVTGYIDSTPLLSSPNELRARAHEDGFLFFKKFLPAELLWELRGQILEIVDRYGWLKKGTNRMDGIGDLDTIALGDSLDSHWKYIGIGLNAYQDIQRLELFHSLQHHPKIIDLYEKLFQATILPHPRAIARALLPSPSLAPTPPHQDFLYIQGTHSFWTCWFPIGDCPMDLGGLSVLRGSHREKVLNVATAPGAGGKESILCGLDYTWVQDNFECGDILTFPSHMVHKALPNRKPGTIRLSCDYRFQSTKEEIDRSSLEPHMGCLTWPEIYEGWKSEDLKYYWEKHTLHPSVWDPDILKDHEKIC
jgi:hypothetical protein